MAHIAPYIVQSRANLQGQSLGFHAYSIRIDNLSNQWFQEQTTLAWIPPYVLGMVLRLYGSAVALILNAAPVGQPQLAAIAGEYAVVVFSDELRVDVAGVPVRQFTLVQSVSDLTEGPQPALPPVSVDRLYADTSGNIHHIHSDGTDLILYDIAQTLSGALVGHLPNPTLAPGSVGSAQIVDGSITSADIGAQQVAQSNIAKPAVGPSELLAGAAAANVGVLTGAFAGALPSPTHVWNQASLGASLALTGGVFQNACGLTLAAGTWLLLSAIQLITGPTGSSFEARITDGATVWSAAGATVAIANGHMAFGLAPVVVSPGGTTTYNLQGYCSGAGASIYPISPATGQAGATRLAALRLA